MQNFKKTEYGDWNRSESCHICRRNIFERLSVRKFPLDIGENLPDSVSASKFTDAIYFTIQRNKVVPTGLLVHERELFLLTSSFFPSELSRLMSSNKFDGNFSRPKRSEILTIVGPFRFKSRQIEIAYSIFHAMINSILALRHYAYILCFIGPRHRTVAGPNGSNQISLFGYGRK